MLKYNTMNTNTIILKNVVKTIGGKKILYDVNLEVKPGEIYGLLGPNKAGKTTTMKILAGLLNHSAGEVWINGLPMPMKRKLVTHQLAFIPDYPLLYDKLTGLEYLNYIYSIFELDENKRAVRIDSMLELFGLLEQAGDLIENYSLGMKQKLSFASAFIRQPRIMLVDEPMNGLDPKSNKLLQDMLSDFAAHGGTVLLSTHILDIAERICGRVGVINHGRTIASGTLNELRGMMNLKSGRLIDIFLAVTDTQDETSI